MATLNNRPLNTLIRDLNTLTRIRMVLFDVEGREVLSYPSGRCDLCTAIRAGELGAGRCRACDQRAFRQCRATDEPMIYRCHVGLTEAVIPLKDKDVLLGYLMFGQVLCGRSEQEERAHLQQLIETTDFGVPVPVAALAHVPWKTPEEIAACATVLKMTTVYMLSSNLVAKEHAAFPQRLQEYLDAHLQQAITVEALCAYFGLSRSTLYQTAMQQLGCGLAEYVRRHRIRRACELLASTAQPIGEIAAQVGFPDQNHFSRAFRQQLGMTARQYRQKQAMFALKHDFLQPDTARLH